MWNNKEPLVWHFYMFKLSTFFLCPFLSTLRLLPLQFPFVSKRSGNFLLFVNARMWRFVDGRRKGLRNFGVYGLLCHLHETQSHKVNCFCFSFHSLPPQHATEGQQFHLRVSVSHWEMKTFKVFIPSSRLSRARSDMRQKLFRDFFSFEFIFLWSFEEKVYWWNFRRFLMKEMFSTILKKLKICKIIILKLKKKIKKIN